MTEARRLYMAKWRERNRARIIERNSTPSAKAYQRKYQKSYRARHKAALSERQRDRQLRSYGGSLDLYRAKWVEQGGCCAICKRPPRDFGSVFQKTLHLDHDHETKTPRGLLCHACNAAIGILLDDASVCRAAAEYLESHGARPKLPRAKRAEVACG